VSWRTTSSAAGSEIPARGAQLSRSVSARRSDVGDRVEAKAMDDVTSGGQVVIPKGSTLIGRVTEAEARGEGSARSSLGILFEKAVTKDGQEIPLNVAIQAVAASRSALAAQTREAQTASSADLGGSASAAGRGSSGGGLLGGVGATAGGAVGATTGAVGGVAKSAVGATSDVAGSAAGALGGRSASGDLSGGVSGVIGLEGLQLQSQATGTAQGSLITSASRDVRLARGTRLLLRAESQASAQ
jgi:hypothetical protein